MVVSRWAAGGGRVWSAVLLVGLAGGANAQKAVSEQAGKSTDETKVMSKEQAKKLFDSVDEITAFASKDTGLASGSKVKRKLVSRDEVGRYLLKNFDEDESAKRLQRSEIVLKKFGLLDADFQLRPFLLQLLTEQIAGFYDSKTKTVNLLNWIEPDEQKPVLAHELTHALQDQKVNLEKWSNNGFQGASRTASEDNERVAVDETETAREAVTEGQAMVVFLDWGLKDVKKSLADSPDVWAKMKNNVPDTNSSPVLARAPLLLQRSLEFPYLDGLNFEHALLVQPSGKQMAFAGALEHPPTSSFEVLHPEAYLSHTPVPVLRLPDVHPLLDAAYEPYDLGVMGELDVEMMTSLFGGPELAKALPQQWAGGVYYAAQRKAATASERAMAGSLGVFYLSRWKSAEAATGFARIYEAELGRKYKRLTERKNDETDSREKVFTTDEGDVLLSRSGDSLFVAEGFPLPLARKLREASADAQGVGPMKMASGTPVHELTLSLADGMGGFGVMKAMVAGPGRGASAGR